jgi:DNA-directed RNA polymerase specialized sigma24 family protein
MDHPDTDFDRFVGASADSLLRTAYLIAWDLGEAEDLVQETLLKLARRWPRVRRMEHPAAAQRHDELLDYTSFGIVQRG